MSGVELFLRDDKANLNQSVFGAGKSFLLAVVIVFLVQLFNMEEDSNYHWKLLISSTTNVAVDRILQGLLDVGFEDFVRVGSMKKIAKQVLPYSVHATGSESQELRELQDMLKGDLIPSEKQLVRKAIEKHRLGKNKAKLSNVRVVGVTCAACDFPCMKKLKFPVVLLDECSQMTEPTSLLPIARFECEKLILVGDPKQLNPTIQGSEPLHKSGLQQTLFDRFIQMI
ncbi:5'-3' DNA helicase ZGRF1-like [Saccoglossus kowalevskii]